MKIPAQVGGRIRVQKRVCNRRDAWNQLVFAREDHDLVQGYEWGESRRYAGFTPYRLAVRDGDEVGALSNILVARSPFGTLMYAPHGPVFAQPAATGPLTDTIRELARETGAILFRACAPTSAYPSLMAAGFRPLTDERIYWNTGRVDVILDITGWLGRSESPVSQENPTISRTVHEEGRRVYKLARS